MHSFVLGNLHYSRMKQHIDQNRYRNERWDVWQFFVKSVDYSEELKHPGRMKHCTQKTLDVLFNRVLKCFQRALVPKTQWAGARSWLQDSRVPTTFILQQGDKQCADVIPQFLLQAGSRICSSLSLFPFAVAQVMTCGSQDWLAIWGRHCKMTGGPIGVWLSRQRPLTMCCRAVPFGFHFCKDQKNHFMLVC